MNKESLLKLVDKVGVWDAAKMVGLSITEVLTITKRPLFAEESYEVLLELIRNKQIPTEYGEFEIYSSGFEGTVYWVPKSSLKSEYKGQKLTEIIMVLATPYWDGGSILPYNVQYYELYNNKELLANEEQPDFYFVKKVPGKFRNIEELLQWYKEVYLPGVYDNIMNTILPQLRAEYI